MPGPNIDKRAEEYHKAVMGTPSERHRLREHRRDLQIDLTHNDQRLVFDAEWRPDTEQWVCEDQRWVIRLSVYGDGKLDTATSKLFNRHAERLYQKVKRRLTTLARKRL